MKPETIRELEKPLDRAHVAKREKGGQQLSYVEGWHVIAEANRIFGFDGWSSETTEIKCVAEREREIGAQKKPGWSVSYIAKVKVVAFAGDTIVTHSRHYDALLKALEEIQKVRHGMESGLPADLMAIDIRQALYHFGEITGQVTNDELLGNIFANFCIGK